ncbi:3' exoribonuclease family protein [Hirsutella rhossiliensis]|uniref:3' exoribonuclease family protein n=1 Tax=Hirsutella rhossiliensis TaxID=111463 RepID=A0A9P8SMG8_9HYPO|nr:3' exoribonuclease family protein [Hirsutella rhossiliensis]KAH0967324.1 3' exoribonuclease family protein [Hirsutella rhossiliensis]
MAPSAEPAAELSHLPKADGSATFSHSGFTVTSAVNGPIEAPRRDENAFEALVDVTVRPAAGVGGTAERQLESILQPALRQLIPVRNFPRCMIQVTLQVMEMPENAYVNTKLLQAQLNLPIIPALLHASILGLMSAAIPLKTIATATTLAMGVDGKDGILVDPSLAEADKARSIHVLGFTSDDELLLAECSGSFTVQEWDKILEAGRSVCCQGPDLGPDTAMAAGGLESQSIKAFIRSTMETKVSTGLYWK